MRSCVSCSRVTGCNLCSTRHTQLCIQLSASVACRSNVLAIMVSNKREMVDLWMREGIGSFVLSDDAAGARRSLRVFYFRPSAPARDARIVIAMHGFDRAASEFRDRLVDEA